MSHEQLQLFGRSGIELSKMTMQTSQVAYSAKMIFGNFSWQRDRLLGLGMASRLVSFGLGVSVFSFSVVLVVSVGSVLCTGVVSGLFRLSSQGK